MLKLRTSDYEAMVAHSVGNAPAESCGLIAGRAEGADAVVEKVFFLENVDHAAEHFTISPAEQLAAVKEARANGWAMLGNWHSHPASPSRPSEEDKRLAFDPRARYLILSLIDVWETGPDGRGRQRPSGSARPVLRCFHVDKVKNVEVEQIRLV